MEENYKKKSWVIPNTWESEFNEWFKQLQKQRQIDFDKKSETGESFDEHLHTRNWGHINHHFATYFWELLESVKELDYKLFKEFCEKANKSLFFWDLNDPEVYLFYKDYLNDKCK